jgi:hypothetical protein
MRQQLKLISISMWLTGALAWPGFALASPVTVDAGSFEATYDTQSFSAGWDVSSSYASVDGWDLRSSQFQVSTGSNRLRIDFVELPPHPVDPQTDNRTGPVTLLAASSAGYYDGHAHLNLPLSLRADVPGDTAYRISLGLSMSGSAYTPFVLPGVFPTPILSQVSGGLSTGYDQSEVALMPVLLTVPPSGMSPATEMVFSQSVSPSDEITSISGVFAARGGYVKGVTAPWISARIEYVEIEALSAAELGTVSVVPELAAGQSMGLGLMATVALAWLRRTGRRIGRTRGRRLSR